MLKTSGLWEVYYFEVGNDALDCQLTPDCSRSFVDSAAAIRFDVSSTATGTDPKKQTAIMEILFFFNNSGT